MIRKFISGFDLFSALPTLRAKGQPEVTNPCGGVFSIVLFSFFIYVFISSMVSTVRLQRISSTEVLKNVKEKRQISNITFGIGLQLLDLSSMLNLFSVEIYYFRINQPLQPLPMKPCSREDWKNLDDTQYQQFRIGTHICLDTKNNSIFGDVGAIDVRALYFRLSICDNSTSPVECAPQFQIDYLFSLMLFSRYLAASMAILDTGFNPSNQKSQIYGAYLNTLWLPFNKQQYSMAAVFTATYNITTDVSFMPVNEDNTQSGYFFYSSNIMTMPTPNNSKILTQGFIVGSSIHKDIQRTYGKVDQVLSYVGGLFGIILSFVGFFILSFNQYRYELRVSEGAFQTKNNHLSKEQNFHFLKYLKYSLYDWIKSLFRCQLNWEDCQAIQESRQEANQQIDIKHLLQRIAHLESVVKTGNSDNVGDTVMYMVKSNSIDDAKKRRSILQYCNKFADSENGTTIATFEQIQAIFSFSESKSQSFLLNSNKNILEMNRTFEEKQEKSSLQIMRQFLDRYYEKFGPEKKEPQLSDEDLNAEKQLGRALLNMKQEKRKQIIKSIPIGILYRLRKISDQISEGQKMQKKESRQLRPVKERKKFTEKNIIFEYKQ